MRNARLFALLFTLLCFGSCRKPAGTNWDVDVVLPIANSHLNISNFVADSLIGADSSGLLHFQVRREVAALLLDSLLQLPDTLITDTLVSPVSISLQPGEKITIFPPNELDFKIGRGIQITFADIRSAFLHVKFSNLVSEPIDLIYRIPSATKYGEAFEIRETVPPGINSLARTYDLSGYRLNMRGENGNKFNTIVQTYTVGLNELSSPVTVNAGEGALLEISYSDIVPQYVEGFFGQDDIEIPADTVNFSFLNNITATNFMLSEASMKFMVVNEIGADFRASLKGISSVNSSAGTHVTLQSSKLDRFHINRAQSNGPGVLPSEDSLVFNTSNSNITAFISNLPDKITYQGSVSINPPPPGDIVGHTNFAYFNGGIRIFADIDIPMKFSANRFGLRTSADIDLENNSQLDNIRGGDFIISVENGFPFDALLQVYMQDAAGAVTDSLLLPGSNRMQRGTLNAQNEVISPARSELRIPVSPSKAINLRRCRKLLIRPVFIMPPNPPDIKILSHYEFDINIRAELMYNVGIRNR